MMTVKDFLTVLYISLVFATLANGQKYSDASRHGLTQPTNFPSNRQQPRSLNPQQPSPFNQPPSSFNQPPSPFNQPPSPFNQPPRPFNQPPNPFTQPPRPFNQPPSHQPTNPFNKPTSPFNQSPNPSNQPPSPFNQPPSPFNQPPTPFNQLPSPNQPPSSLPHQPTSPYQQTTPLPPHQPSRINSPPTILVVHPSTLSDKSVKPDSTGPQQATQSYSSPQSALPNSSGIHHSNPSSTSLQQTDPDSISLQQNDSNSTILQQTYPDSTNLQQNDPDSTSLQQTDPDSTSLQQTDPDSTNIQQTDPDSTSLQQTDPNSKGPQKTNLESINAEPIASASETSSSVSNTSQNTSSLPTARQNSTGNSQGHTSKAQLNSQSSGDPLYGMRIVCLFNNRHYYRTGLTPSLIDPSLCTHLNYEFAILDPKTSEIMVGEPDLDTEMDFYQEAIDLKQINPKLKVLLSLGGWGDSTKKYSDLAADPAKRENFIQKAVEFLKKHDFDGLDFAWEYPNCWQGAIGVSPKDKSNFVILLKELKDEFKKHGLILSVSVGAIKREVEAAYDVPGISSIVDYINVMTYDMHGPWESKTSHHVQFEAMPGDKDPYCNVKGGMQVWIDKGADKKKLNMGLAFYGRNFRLAHPKQCAMGIPALGPGAPGPKSKEGGILSYNEICDYLNSGNWTEKQDPHAGFYACCEDQWVGYDPPLMMVRKTKFVVQHGLGGVLLKDLGGDDYTGKCFNMPFPLLRMVYLETKHRAPRRNSKQNH